MSVDTYFCFCCLSTNELTTLFNNNTDTNYAVLLKELFLIKLSPEEYEDDSYICEECARKLRDVHQFKSQILDTLNILQMNGLIKMRKMKSDHIVLKKVSSGFYSDLEEKCGTDVGKDVADVKNYEEKLPEDTKIDVKPVEQNLIKQELVDQNNLQNVQILNGSEIIRSLLSNDPLNAKIERDKRITTPKKRKREEVKREPEYVVTEDFKCQFCSTVLPNVYVYHTHMNQHFPNHICETCGKGFLTERRLKRHMPSHKTGPFKCESCDAEFTNYNTLSSHRQRKHSSVQLYRCPQPQCGERFATFTRRARHLLAAHAQPSARYSCKVCRRRFLLAGNLSSHMRNKHLKVKRHFCTECGAGFFQKQELRGHMATHTGISEFQCALCPKRYPRKKALDVHMRVHTNDRRFCCDTCGKKFIQKCTLLSHLKVHNRKIEDKKKVVEEPLLIGTDMECYNYDVI